MDKKNLKNRAVSFSLLVKSRLSSSSVFSFDRSSNYSDSAHKEWLGTIANKNWLKFNSSSQPKCNTYMISVISS